jgi:hypothetical protein
MSDDQTLRSKLFFLDTETYVARNFQFDSSVLKTLRSHLEEDDCHLLITDVNVREIRRHLRRKASEAHAFITKAKKDAMILRNTTALPWHGIFANVSADEIYDELVKKFEAFLDHGSVEIVPTNTVDINVVFDAYFGEKPPFAIKKSEFPDAFVLLAINAISKQRGHQLYVVSQDKDVKGFCGLHENLISVNRLDELLALVLKNTERLEEPAKFAEETFGEWQLRLQEEIEQKIKNHEFQIAYDYEDGIDEAEVQDVEIESVKFLGKNLTDVSKEHAEFSIVVKICLVVTVEYPDYDRSPWDSEDKEFAFVLYNELVQRYTKTAEVSVSFIFDDGLAANVELGEIDADALLDLADAKVEQISFQTKDLDDDFMFDDRGEEPDEAT